MTQIVAVCNQKGGVGKTTVTINLGAALANLGHKALLIDLDPQGHLTEGVGLQEFYLKDSPTLYHALVKDDGVTLSDLIHNHEQEKFAVVPSNYQLMLAEQALFMARNREHKLKKLVQQIDNQYEWILIDCPPALGHLTDNAMNAACQVLVPIQAESTSVRALELLFDQIESIERGLNIRVRVLAVVPNLVQDSAMSKQILAQLHQSIPTITPFEIRKRVLLQYAWDTGCSIFTYTPKDSKQAETREELIELYRRLAKFIQHQAKGHAHA
jgi:chromosome partitioning protein